MNEFLQSSHPADVSQHSRLGRRSGVFLAPASLAADALGVFHARHHDTLLHSNNGAGSGVQTRAVLSVSPLLLRPYS